MLKIGHRGAAGIAPENTLPAFKKAIESGLDMVELDIQLSKDEKLVVVHDRDLSRVADCKAQVKDLTVEELKKLEVGSWYQEKFRGVKIPTLQEVIELAQGNLKLNIEIKPGLSNNSLVIRRLLDLLADKNFCNQVVISSFDHSLVKRVKDINPHLKTAVLMAACPLKPVKVIEWANSDGFHLEYQMVSKELVTKVKSAGYFINTWTVNELTTIKHLQQIGVTGVISDYPSLLKK